MVFFEFITAFATFSMAGAAWVALDTWKKQIKTTHKIQTLDNLMLKIESFNFEARQVIFDAQFNNNFLTQFGHITEYADLVERMTQESDSRDTSHFDRNIKKLDNLVKEIITLIRKCQIYNFKNYSELKKIGQELTDTYNFLQAYNGTFHRRYMNPSNEEVQQVLNSYIFNFPTDILNSKIDESSDIFIRFYKKIFKTHL